MLTTSTITRHNPYVGPRALCYGESIYGRGRESADLVDLLIAERIVLLYSPSGAGKTSLIQAAVIPALEQEDFTVLPVIRVGHPLPLTTGNRYLLSTLLSLEQNVPSNQTLPAEQLATISLSEYLQRRDRLAEQVNETVLIFDQFEEILTLDPLDREAKKEFFLQIGAALRDSGRWALFAMREDHIAGLDSYVLPVPTRLKSTFRLELLSVEGALHAIQEPAHQQGVDFTDEAAAKLIDDLRQVTVQEPDGTAEKRPGPYVEPVQLQVVCYRIWEKLSEDSNVIRPEEVASAGEIDTALAEYYADRVRQIAEDAGVKERFIREWIDSKLITESGVRGQVLKGDEETLGLSDAVIRQLQDVHLVRGEERRGIIWLELCHDRLLKPIRDNNTAWFNHNLNILQKQASNWQRQGRPPSLYLYGRDLADAQCFANKNTSELTNIEREFLKACEAHQRAARWRKASLVQMPAIVCIAVLAAMAIGQSGRLKEQSDRAKKLEEIATARSVAARSVALLDEQLDLALILAHQAWKMAVAPDTQDALFSASVHNPRLLKFLNGHLNAIGATAFSADGNLLAAGDHDGNITLWDARTGHLMRFFEKHRLVGDAVRYIAFSADGRYMGVSSKDYSVVLWDRAADSVVPLQQKNNHTARSNTPRNVWSLSFSSDSSMLVSGDSEGRVIVWDVAKHKQSAEMPRLQPGEIRAVAFHHSGQMIAAGGKEGSVTLWQREGERWGVFDKYSVGANDMATVTCAGFSPDGALLAIGTSNGILHLRDVQAKRSLEHTGIHEGPITSLSYDPGGSRIVTSSDDGTLRLWNIPSMEQAGPPLTGHTGPVLCSASWRNPHTGELRVGSGGMDRKVILWNATLPIPKLARAAAPASRFCYVFSPDGSCEASGYETGTMVIRFRKGGDYIELPARHPKRLPTMAFSRDSRFLVSSSRDGTVLVHDLRDKDAVKSWPINAGKNIMAAALNRDGTCIATAKDNGEVTLWDCATSKPLNLRLDNSPAAINTLDFSPDGRFLAGGGDEHFAVVWSLATGKAMRLPDLHNGKIRYVAFSPESKTLVTSSNDHTLRLWNVESGEPLGPPLAGHHAPVVRAVFSPDGKRLASGSEDRSVLLWDVATSQPFGPRLLTHFDTVRTLNFAPDGKSLFSGSYPGDTVRWELDPITWEQLCRERSNRNLTRAEWNVYMHGAYQKIWPQLPDPDEGFKHEP